MNEWNGAGFKCGSGAVVPVGYKMCKKCGGLETANTIVCPTCSNRERKAFDKATDGSDRAEEVEDKPYTHLPRDVAVGYKLITDEEYTALKAYKDHHIKAIDAAQWIREFSDDLGIIATDDLCIEGMARLERSYRMLHNTVMNIRYPEPELEAPEYEIRECTCEACGNKFSLRVEPGQENVGLILCSDCWGSVSNKPGERDKILKDHDAKMKQIEKTLKILIQWLYPHTLNEIKCNKLLEMLDKEES